MKPAPILLLLAATASATAGDLRLAFDFRFNGAPLVFDSPANTNAAGQTVSISRLDFLLSDFALRRVDGAWISRTNWFACVRARDGRTSAVLSAVPPARYDRVHFNVGLDPAANHSDAAKYPAGHPLNPEVNGLHWGWTGGYVFLALEGGWRDQDRPGGFSFHLATDRNLMTVELPAALALDSDRELQIVLDAGKIFSAPNTIELTAADNSTHSRADDVLAGWLTQNVESAFSVEAVRDYSPVAELTRAPGNLVIAPHATPYRLTIAEFFPRPDLPRDNPLTGEGVVLGGRLFFDRRLSDGDRLSCAACHHPREAFAENRRFSRGVDGAIGTRNAPALLNLAWKNSFFWDGRAATLREQVLQPIQNPIEMHESLSNAVAKLSRDATYPAQFKAAFGSSEITADCLARALEQFLLAQVSFDSKLDRVLLGRAKLTAQEQRGLELFNTESDPGHGQHGADCFHCHGGPLFSDHQFHNNGLDSVPRDLGRYLVTSNNADRGKFATPTLRNVELTAPYMHDGRFPTLESVIAHYNTGVRRSATLDPNLARHPDLGLQLSPDDQRALVAFLKTLTDDSLRPAPPPPAIANR